MALSFLSQLSTFGSTSHAHVGSGTKDHSDDFSDISTARHRAKARIELQLVDRSKRDAFGSDSLRCFKYPRKCAHGGFRPMAQMLRVLDLAHEAILDDTPATKRDIYYKDVSLFKTQRTVDSLVDDIAATLALQRSDLNIRAASKGLVTGAGLVVYLHSGDILRSNDTEGTLIPVGEEIKALVVDPSISWVLIIEKEAVFQTLCRLRLTDHPFLTRGLMITGKGYPDIATRCFVKMLGDLLPARIPILALVDGDPYGIDILSVYKFGSRGLQHEKSKLATDRIIWLGLWSSELASFDVDRSKLLPITKHDETKALSLLQRPPDAMPAIWRKELVHMLHCRRKAEIEILSTSNLTQLLQTTDQRQLSSTEPMTVVHCLDDPLDAHYTTVTHSDTDSSALHPAVIHSSLLSNSSSNPTKSLALESSPFEPSHAPLMQYLVFKISEAVRTSIEHST